MPSTINAKRPVVFVVDDDVSVRESLEHLILTAGWEPVIFDSAERFLELADVGAPSCLILDVNMPGLNGLDLQREMARDRRNVPIIFVTGYDEVPMTTRAMEAGAVEFLTKPLDTRVLLQAVRTALAYAKGTPRQQEDPAPDTTAKPAGVT
jgi:FixJ family two-component response regulator